MIKAEYAHEALRKNQKYPLGLLEKQKYAELEQYFTALWNSRLTLPAFEWEKNWFNYPYAMFKDIFLHHGALVLKYLNEWSEKFPSSFFPYIVRVRYWAFWASEYRGGGWSSSVSDEMWDCAREAQKQLYVTAIQALNFSNETWTVLIHLLNTSAKLDEPKWFSQWLFKGKMPQKLTHQIKPNMRELASKSGLNHDLKLVLPENIPSLLEPYIHSKSHLDLPQSHAAFWLKILLDQSGYGLIAAIDYCWYLLPRWGHSYNAIHQFIQSSWCDHFSEIEKNELRFVIWYDSIENSYSKDQVHEIKKQIELAQDLLTRPLSEENIAKIYLRLAYFYELLDEKDPQISVCYKKTINHEIFDEYDIHRVIDYWFKFASDQEFLGQIAISNRNVLAAAAVLYGLLAQHGWSGVEKNPLVSESWYEFAKTLEKPKGFPEGEYCCFYRVAKSFDHPEHYNKTINLLHSASALGYVYPSFSCGYIHSLEKHALYDNDVAKYYSEKAAQQGHYVAMYNVGVNYLNRGISDAESQPEALLKQSLDYFEQARIGLEKSRLKGTYEYQELENDIIDLYSNYLYHYSYFNELGNKIVPLLIHHGWKRHIKAMAALAKLFVDRNNRPEYFDYLEAVKWSEAAKAQKPDDDDVILATEMVETASFKNILKYQLMVDKIPVEEIPGRQNVLF